MPLILLLGQWYSPKKKMVPIRVNALVVMMASLASKSAVLALSLAVPITRTVNTPDRSVKMELTPHRPKTRFSALTQTPVLMFGLKPDATAPMCSSAKKPSRSAPAFQKTGRLTALICSKPSNFSPYPAISAITRKTAKKSLALSDATALISCMRAFMPICKVLTKCSRLASTVL